MEAVWNCLYLEVWGDLVPAATAVTKITISKAASHRQGGDPFENERHPLIFHSPYYLSTIAILHILFPNYYQSIMGQYQLKHQRRQHQVLRHHS